MENKVSFDELNKEFEVMKKEFGELKEELEQIKSHCINLLELEFADKIEAILDKRLKEVAYKQPKENEESCEHRQELSAEFTAALKAQAEPKVTQSSNMHAIAESPCSEYEKQSSANMISSNVSVCYSLPGSKSTIVTVCKDSLYNLPDHKELFLSQQYKNLTNFSKTEIKNLCSETIKEDVPTITSNGYI
eukprot:TRINITY_DN872_c0_g1_i2.p1 TRINITY_DN872_c0_g1~~TRINITY_DN872_c0_g1_i2.p1  ORF type:complete len:191 (+),score=36.89 TRINITY_DN872_c0_g1_i2:83-655(+)